MPAVGAIAGAASAASGVAQLGAAAGQSEAESDATTAISMEVKSHLAANDLKMSSHKHSMDSAVQNAV
jgi:hypothetical protein